MELHFEAFFGEIERVEVEEVGASALELGVLVGGVVAGEGGFEGG